MTAEQRAKVINSLLLREGVKGSAVLEGMVDDCEMELVDYLNYTADNQVTDDMLPIIKELVLIAINRDGVEGIKSESIGGTSTNYLDDIPKALKRRILKRRKLPKGGAYVNQ